MVEFDPHPKGLPQPELSVGYASPSIRMPLNNGT